MNITYFIKPTSLEPKEFLDSLNYYDWDIKIRKKQLKVYSSSVCYHSQGGTGDNNLWCIEEGLEHIPENFNKFEGKHILWGMRCSPENYYRKGSLKTSFTSMITRNGKDFYEVRGNNFDYVYTNIRNTIYKLDDFVIGFHQTDWLQQIEGRKIWWRNYPAIIKDFVSPRGCVTIIPDEKEMSKKFNIKQQKHYLEHNKVYFPAARWEKEDFGNDFSEEHSILTDLFDPNIDWFRS